MYTQAEIRKALKTWEKTKTVRGTCRILCYPSIPVLRKWIKEYTETGRVRTVAWRKHTKAQKRKAIHTVLKNGGNVKKTVKELGYPSVTQLRLWLKQYLEKHPDALQPSRSTAKYRANRVEYSMDIKMQAVSEFRHSKSSAIAIARKFGISRQTLYAWDKEFPMPQVEQSMQTMAPPKKHKRKTTNSNSATDLDAALEKVAELEKQVTMLVNESEDLQKQIYHLKLQKDVLVKAAEILKKGQGINPSEMSNRDKARVIDALRNSYKLKDLLVYLDISKSSYCYQHNAINKPDKYADLAETVKNIFLNNYRCYGYRRIYFSLKNKGIVLSEKVVRRLMKDEGLVVQLPKKRKYSSYKGEICPPVPNLINRDFHADKPNEKWLTDITEFALPTGKVYLSPLIDCYDGLPVAWSISISPNAHLVNSMLKKALETLKPEEHPTIHSDRGCHYQWPEWIKLLNENGLKRSMSKKGCSPDNSACEGFFGRLKNEMFYNRSWEGVSIPGFIKQLESYLHWYRDKRLKITLGGQSPMEFRKQNLLLEGKTTMA